MIFEVSTFIQRPIAEVFAFFRDIERYAGLPGSVVSVYEKLTPGPTGVGTRYREVIRLSPWYAMENLSEITEFDPLRRLASRYRFCNVGLHGSLRYDFVSSDDGTYVRQRQTLESGGRLRPLRPIIRLTFKHQLRRRLAAIKFLLEQSDLV